MCAFTLHTTKTPVIYFCWDALLWFNISTVRSHHIQSSILIWQTTKNEWMCVKSENFTLYCRMRNGGGKRSPLLISWAEPFSLSLSFLFWVCILPSQWGVKPQSIQLPHKITTHTDEQSATLYDQNMHSSYKTYVIRTAASYSRWLTALYFVKGICRDFLKCHSKNLLTDHTTKVLISADIYTI